jgi:hypothetical protein
MGYKEIRKFRDGTVMVELDGVTSIIGTTLNEHLKKKNWPALVADKLQKQFPHMKIEYVDEEMPGISIESANPAFKAFCNWDKEDSPEAMYDASLGIVASLEDGAIKKDKNYFSNNYININSYAK